MSALKSFSDGIWTAAAAQSFHGVQLGTRMTVVRLSDGRLWVHSPIALNENLAQGLRALGEVAFVVAPNRLHHLYLPDFCVSYPQARAYLAPKLGKKLRTLYPGFEYEAELEAAVPADWARDLDQQLMAGIPRFQEVVFLHRPSGTLIVTDAIYDLAHAPARSTRLLSWLLRRRQPGALFLEPALKIVRDDELVRPALQRIAKWDFRHLVMAHGACIRDRGKQAFLHAYAELLE